MTQQRIRRLLKGAIDLHVHSAPSHMRRRMNDLEVAQAAKEAGMGAILIKDHLTQTADRAQIASLATGFPVYGGIALNLSVGGLNLAALKGALPYGIQQVWMPTLDAAQFLHHQHMVPGLNPYPEETGEGIHLLEPGGALRPEMTGILRFIAEHDLLLGTGHICAQEGKALVREAFALGVKKILITHPQAPFLDWTLADMVEVVGLGAFLEHDIVFSTPAMKGVVPSKEIAEVIRATGPAHNVMATDSGQATGSTPVEMMSFFIEEMMTHGIGEEEIEQMVTRNPAVLLGQG